MRYQGNWRPSLSRLPVSALLADVRCSDHHHRWHDISTGGNRTMWSVFNDQLEGLKFLSSYNLSTTVALIIKWEFIILSQNVWSLGPMSLSKVNWQLQTQSPSSHNLDKHYIIVHLVKAKRFVRFKETSELCEKARLRDIRPRETESVWALGCLETGEWPALTGASAPLLWSSVQTQHRDREDVTRDTWRVTGSSKVMRPREKLE